MGQGRMRPASNNGVEGAPFGAEFAHLVVDLGRQIHFFHANLEALHGLIEGF